MGLNNIELPAALVADLYKDSLLQTESVMPTAAANTPDPIVPLQYLGNNLKNVVLLVDYKDDVYLPENQLTFLTNILLACKLNLADVAIVNYNKQQPTFASIVKKLQPGCLVVFGLSLWDSSLSGITEFNIQQINNCAVITSPNLENLNNTSAEGKLLKSKLWLCLKQQFNV